MKRQHLFAALLLLLPFILSGCSLSTINLAFSNAPVSQTSTTAATAEPAVGTPAAAPTPAFDLQAGNCPDASNQAIALMIVVQSEALNLDMSLALTPVRVSCGSTDGALNSYRAQVTSATLSAYVIDNTWTSLLAASRITILDDVIRQLHALYPAAISQVLVYENNAVVGSIVLGADNKPQVNCCIG